MADLEADSVKDFAVIFLGALLAGVIMYFAQPITASIRTAIRGVSGTPAA